MTDSGWFWTNFPYKIKGIYKGNRWVANLTSSKKYFPVKKKFLVFFSVEQLVVFFLFRYFRAPTDLWETNGAPLLQWPPPSEGVSNNRLQMQLKCDPTDLPNWGGRYLPPPSSNIGITSTIMLGWCYKWIRFPCGQFLNFFEIIFFIRRFSLPTRGDLEFDFFRVTSLCQKCSR